MVIQLLRKFIIPYLYLFFANKGEVKAIIIVYPLRLLSLFFIPSSQRRDTNSNHDCAKKDTRNNYCASLFSLICFANKGE